MAIGPRSERRFERRPGRRMRRSPLWMAPIGVAIIVLAVLVVPSFMYEEKPPSSRPYLVYRGERRPYPVVVESGEAYVPFEFIKAVIDPDAFAEDGLVVVTTKDKVVKLWTDSQTAHVNQNPVELRLPVILENGQPYIPASALELLYPVSTSLYDDARTFVVRRADAEKDVAQVVEDAIVRPEPFFLAKRTGILPAGASVEAFETEGGWTRVQGENGISGWMHSNKLSGRTKKPAEVSPPLDYTPAPLQGNRVSLVWEQVERYTPDTSGIGPLEGANVVSPTWFRLGSNPGDVENYVDARYVSWAHGRGYKVWALFSNSFELERTRAVLRNSDLRDKVISQILVYAKMYSLDGINIDFENVYRDDAPYLTQFMRELTPMLHEAGLVVSMDVTVKSLSPTWSLCYERERLAEVVDYMMLMAYDQYPAGSSVAGPNSSITWAKYTVETSLKEIPAKKLVLGMPFYMRLWKESKGDDGKIKVSQRAISMKQAQDWLRTEKIAPVFQSDTGLMYAEKTIGSDTFKLWIEDASSIQKRCELADSYGLAGVAAWRRGFENEDVWDAIADYIGK